jgi:hypothetical protein
MERSLAEPRKKFAFACRVPLHHRGELSPGTSARHHKGPDRGDDPVVFVTYSPQDRPKDPSIVNIYPPDPCGDDSEPGVILQTGNDYIRYSNDRGKTFQILANTAVINNSFAGGQNGDQIMLFVPGIRCFVWYMQYNANPTTGDGAFRLSFAKLSDLQTAFGIRMIGCRPISDFLQLILITRTLLPRMNFCT